MTVRALLRTAGDGSGKDGRLDEGAETAADAAGAARERAHGLLRDLLTDLDGGTPHGGPPDGGAPHGGADAPAPPTSLDGARLRRLGRGPVVAVLAVGVLSFGGVAAASTQVSAGNPLHGLGTVVRAAGSILSPGGPSPLARPGATSQAAPAAEVRAAATERQVDDLLRTADELLVAGRVDEAWAELERAELALGSTPGADASARRAQAKELRDRLKPDGTDRIAPGDDKREADLSGDDPGKAAKTPGEQDSAPPAAPEAPATTAPAAAAPAATAPADDTTAPTAPAPEAPAAQPPAPTTRAPASKPSTSRPPSSGGDGGAPARSGSSPKAPSRGEGTRSE